MKRLAVLLGLLLAGLAPPAFAALDPEEAIRAGTARLLDKDPPAAERAFADLAEGSAAFTLPFFRGLVTLARAETAEDPTPALDAFLEEAAPAFDAAEAAREVRPKDAPLHLFLGMAWGTRAMVEGARGHYLSAYRSLRRALERAAAEGHFTADLAAMALMHLRVGAEQFTAALPFAERLAGRYPGNPDFAFLLAFLYGETGRHAEAAAVAERIRAAMEGGHGNYGPETHPRYVQLLGKLAMDRGQHKAALEHFERAYAARTPRLTWVAAWAATRAGMVHDLLGEREAAIRRYEQALALEGDGPAHAAARRHLKEPFQGRVRPGP